MPRTQYFRKPIYGWEIAEADFLDIVAWCHPDAFDGTAHTITINNVLGVVGDFVINNEDGMFKIVTALELIRYYEDEVAVEASQVSLPEFGAVYVNDIQVLSDQVPAIGLDAKSDAAKITDLIAALRAHGLIGPDA